MGARHELEIGLSGLIGDEEAALMDMGLIWNFYRFAKTKGNSDICPQR